MEFLIIFGGMGMMIVGAITGVASNLDEPVNTATLVFLTGVIIVFMGFSVRERFK